MVHSHLNTFSPLLSPQQPFHLELTESHSNQKKYLKNVWKLHSAEHFFNKFDIASKIVRNQSHAKILVNICEIWLKTNPLFSWTPNISTCLDKALELEKLKISVNTLSPRNQEELKTIQCNMMFYYYKMHGNNFIMPPSYETIQKKILESTSLQNNTTSCYTESNKLPNDSKIDRELLTILELDHQPVCTPPPVNELFLMINHDTLSSNTEKNEQEMAMPLATNLQQIPADKIAETNKPISLSEWQEYKTNSKLPTFPKLPPFDDSYTPAMHSFLTLIWTKRVKKISLDFVAEANILTDNDPDQRDILIQNCSQWLSPLKMSVWSTKEEKYLQMLLKKRPKSTNPQYLRDRMMRHHYLTADTPLRPQSPHSVLKKIHELKAAILLPNPLKRTFEDEKLLHPKRVKLIDNEIQ